MQLQPWVQVREEKFGAVIFDTHKENIYVTDEVGRDILKQLATPKALEELVRSLSQLYEGEVEVIRKDIVDFLDKLRPLLKE
jgi:hypothetical protein